MPADEGREAMGFIFHCKDEGSAQTSYQRSAFQGFSVRAGGQVPLPATVSALRCQRGPQEPDGDHLFARLFYRDRIEKGTTLESLGFSAEEAAVFSEIRLSLTGTVMAAHVPAIEAALGRVLAADGLYVTADAGLHYDDRTLYRRAQPGRPGLNRMETALDTGRQDVTGIAAADGFTADVSGDADAGGTGRVTGDAGATNLEAGSMEAGATGSASLSVSSELLVGRAVAGPVTAGTAAVTGRLEAGSLSATGGLTAGTLAAAAKADIAGSSSAHSVAGEILTANGTLRADRISATGLHGPDASIGSLTVGSCGGC